MKLTLKTIITISIALLIFIIITSAASNQIILRGYKQLEEDRMNLSALRVIEAFEVEKENLVTKVSDWAVWDDSYQYIQDKNEDYITANLQPLALENLKINMMIFVDKNGTIIESKGYDLDKKEPQEVPQSILDLFHGREFTASHDQDYKSGLMDSPEGPLFFASRPILQTSGEGPYMGTIIFIRYFDHQQIARLASITKVNLTGYYPSETLPEDFNKEKHMLAKDNAIFVTARSDGEIAADFHILTLDGQPGIFFRILSPRDIYALGKQTGMYSAGLLVLLGCVSVVIVIILLGRLVLEPLTRIQKEVQRIQTSGNATEQLALNGLQDEFLLLSRDVNEMLSSLQEKSAEMQKMNSLMVGRELRMQELKLKNADLEKQLVNKV